MRDPRRRKLHSQVSFLSPSWILPSDDGQDSLSIPPAESSASLSEKQPATPASKEASERPSSQESAPPESQTADRAEKPTPVKEKKKARYARQHSSQWLEHDVAPDLDKAEQPPPRDKDSARSPMDMMRVGSSSASPPMVSSTQQPPFSSIFRARASLHRSPGYDAPAISPPVSSTYSPGYGQ
ncbi:uncharacterized protein DSM5745_07535 [Aspergillus mulundensis]|uniref:Uncharacterized protein n=1 Tax=Aspergillus mulundensis TaxID=1810919 RepID=A0A3D8RE68_9EURO|nr:hypothetical protein DSM5745_07535 [Aspergillus mulundensis]RDW72363.1 hypothetical protein DSM5745_07535 [Aspergillus mulundensis]